MNGDEELITEEATEKKSFPLTWVLVGFGATFLLWMMLIVAVYVFSETSH